MEINLAESWDSEMTIYEEIALYLCFLKKFLFFWYIFKIMLWCSSDMYFPVLEEDLYQKKEKHMTLLMMATEKTDNILILYDSQLS